MLRSCPYGPITVATGLEVCIYSAHQDSATIRCHEGTSAGHVRAVSLPGDSAIISCGVISGLVAIQCGGGMRLRGVPESLVLRGRAIQVARPVVASLQHLL